MVSSDQCCGEAGLSLSESLLLKHQLLVLNRSRARARGKGGRFNLSPFSHVSYHPDL